MKFVREEEIFSILAMTFLAFSILFFITGCEKERPEGKEESVTIVFKHGKVVGDPEPIRELIREFEHLNPGMKVKEETLPAATDEQHQFYVINLGGGSKEFDVFSLDVIWGPEFAKLGWLSDLTSILPPERRKEFFKGPVDAVTYKGKIYAVPWYIDAGVLYYRKDLLNRYGFNPPETWDELVRIAKYITEKDSNIHGFVWQGKQYEGLVCNALEYIWSFGGDVLKDGKVLINSPQNIKAMTFMRDLVHKHRVSPESVTNAAEEEARIIFGKGNAVFMRNWPYAWNIYNRSDSTLKGKVGVTTLPHIKGSDPASTLGGWQLGINRFSRHPEEAKKFIEFFTSKRSQKTISKTIGFKPTIKSLYKDGELKASQPFITELYDVFEKARPRPVSPFYASISQVLQEEFSAVLNRIKEPEDAMKSAEEKIKSIIGEGP